MSGNSLFSAAAAATAATLTTYTHRHARSQKKNRVAPQLESQHLTRKGSP